MMKKIIISQLALVLLVVSCHSADESSNYGSKIEMDNITNSLASEETEEMSYYDESVLGNASLFKSEGTVVSTFDNNVSSGAVKPKKKPVNKINSKIIRTADLKLKVEDVKKTSSKIANLVDMHGGYVSSENLISDKSYYQKIKSTEDLDIQEYEIVTSNVMYLRVPSKEFQKVLSSMKGLSISEDYVKINSQDVSEEYVDLETRLKTKKEVEARYIEILRSKAKNLEDILIAEDKIRVIREEIEAVEGRLNFLKNKVNLSTIQVEIYQEAFYIQETIKVNTFENTDWSFAEKMGNSISAGWDGVLWFLIGVLYFWPFWIIGGIVFWIIRRRLRK